MSDTGDRNIHAPCELRISALEKRLESALAEIAELRERLNQNSQNSSKPPSSDPPNAPVRPAKRRTGRKPGGQPGHPAHFRALVPPEKVKIVPVIPDACGNCGFLLTGTDSNPLPHQVVEIPKVEPEVTEYRLHCLTCQKCKQVTMGELPKGVPAGNFGPRLVASVAYLSGAFRLSKRLVQDLVRDLLGVEMSLGSIIACERATSHALAEPVERAKEYVKQQGVKHADESSWFEGATRAKVWLWVATTQLVTVFLIRASRGTEVAREMLGSVLGVLVSDRWCAYNWWPLESRQLCWSHIKRHFQAFEDAGGEAGTIGTALLEEEKKLFRYWHRVRDGTLQRSTFRKYVRQIRSRVQPLLERGARCSHRKTAGTCTELLKLEPALWTFAWIERVEPTNNSGERAIRPGVIWRKLCFGTHSAEGSRFVERILTVVYSLKQQKRHALEFVVDCVTGTLNGDSPQSLLPSAN